MSPPPNFNRIARAYLYFEYLTLGPLLQRTRLHFLPHLLHSRQALVLGDGDGRFLAQLLAANPHLHAEAVDLSPAMLQLLAKRSPTPRLETVQADARTFQPQHGPYDLVVTHFFLDCLTEPELDILVARLAAHLTPSALWLVSDFRIPMTGPLRLPARALVHLLYLACRLLTGLSTNRLPDHAAALSRNGLQRLDRHLTLGGILTAELWGYSPQPTPSPRIGITSKQDQQGEFIMTTPSPVPALPSIPGTDLPTGPSTPGYDPIPAPEPPSPSLPEPDPGVFEP